MNCCVANRPRFLVVGASGFIGSHLLGLIRSRDYRVVGTQSAQRSPNLTKFRLGEDGILDCLDSSFMKTEDPLVAVHCATYGTLDRCRVDREASWRVNVQATQQAMRSLDGAGFRQVFLSTSFVFDGATGCYSEEDQCAPISDYGRQKLEMERWIQQNLVDCLVLRLDKVFGSDPKEAHLLSEWWRLALGGHPIVCIKGQFLSPTLVDDVARGILCACEHRLSGLYHLAGCEHFHRDDLARQFLKTVGKRVDVLEATHEELGLADRRPERSCLDSSKFNRETDFEYTSLKEAFRTFADLLALGGSS